MLSKLITSVNWRVLSFLADNEASLSEISRKTGTTKANTFRSLKGLEELDLARKTIQGKTHVYRFNFLHPEAGEILELITEERRMDYSKKFGNMPLLLHAFLSETLKEKYKGCIFFGSSLAWNKFNDIDVFVVLKEKEAVEIITSKLKLIDKRISPIFGTEEELEAGVNSQDMLYKNIACGIPFGPDLVNIKHKQFFLRKQDIRERFMFGYRELLSCLEFPEKKYQEVHFKRGLMDFIYSILNYYDLAPKNDVEAIQLFKKTIAKRVPATAKEAIRTMEKNSWIL